MLSVSLASVSAQEIGVDSMDNEQLTALLLQILNKLQQEEGSEAEMQVTPAPTATPVPAADPETIEEIIQITIYENKKLTVEALPSYMFIQPTTPPKPEPDDDDADKPRPTPVCPYPSTWACDIHGNCMCGVG